MRFAEVIGIVTFLFLTLLIGENINLKLQHEIIFFYMILASLIVSLIAADILSGLAHWTADTWFSLSTPVLGQAFIRSFREHHIDPLAITRHDFIETNGATALVTVLPMGLVFFFSRSIETNLSFFMVLTGFLTLILVFGTNQFHKWSHMTTVHPSIRMFQTMRLILSAEHHAQHHQSPFDKNYCITTGWLNYFFMRVQFFRSLEKTITWISGAQPRCEDKITIEESSHGF